jgi:methionine synthase II (cobalamin-independent)
MKSHKHYELAYRAHLNVSFSPERRAEQYCSEFDESVAHLKQIGVEQYKVDKFEKLWINHLHAKSRCLSSMVTGPAKFPTERARKANDREHDASVACAEYYKKILDEAKKEAYYEKNPHKRPIKSDDCDAIERLNSKIASLKKAHETMLAANKLLRKKEIDKTALIDLLGEKNANEILVPDYMGKIGFPGYSLSNNRAEIKRLEQRLSDLTKTKTEQSSEQIINGVEVIKNTEIMRLQLKFDGKPEEKIRLLLKSSGFKWAPSQKAWQRQLNDNALYSFEHKIKKHL